MQQNHYHPVLSLPQINMQDINARYRLSEVAEWVTPSQSSHLCVQTIQPTGVIHFCSSGLIESVLLDSDHLHTEDRDFPNCPYQEAKFSEMWTLPQARGKLLSDPSSSSISALYPIQRVTPTLRCPGQKTQITTHFLSLWAGCGRVLLCFGFKGTKLSQSCSGYFSTFMNFHLYCNKDS